MCSEGKLLEMSRGSSSHPQELNTSLVDKVHSKEGWSRVGAVINQEKGLSFLCRKAIYSQSSHL